MCTEVAPEAVLSPNQNTTRRHSKTSRLLSRHPPGDFPHRRDRCGSSAAVLETPLQQERRSASAAGRLDPADRRGRRRFRRRRRQRLHPELPPEAARAGLVSAHGHGLGRVRHREGLPHRSKPAARCATSTATATWTSSSAATGRAATCGGGRTPRRTSTRTRPGNAASSRPAARTSITTRCSAISLARANRSSRSGTSGPPRSSWRRSRPIRAPPSAGRSRRCLTNAKPAGVPYIEGASAFDVDADGKLDILACDSWFKHTGGKEFKQVQFALGGGLIFAGHFKPSKYPQIVISPGDGGGRVRWYECTGNPENAADWKAHDLLDRDVIHGHSLQLGDVNGDGHLDIFVAEMAKWKEKNAQPDHPQATAWILYGDGQGNFTHDRAGRRPRLARSAAERPRRRRRSRPAQQALHLGNTPRGRVAEQRPQRAVTKPECPLNHDFRLAPVFPIRAPALPSVLL